MLSTRIVPGLWMIPAGPVNTFLLDSPGGCTLIDCGLPDSPKKILRALQELGKKPRDIRHIVLTHAHPDHIGGFAALKRETGAETYVHSIDAGIVTVGSRFRPMKAAPGLRTGVLFRLFVRFAPVEGAPVDRHLEDGQQLPIAGGLSVIHIPGHLCGASSTPLESARRRALRCRRVQHHDGPRMEPRI